MKADLPAWASGTSVIALLTAIATDVPPLELLVSIVEEFDAVPVWVVKLCVWLEAAVIVCPFNNEVKPMPIAISTMIAKMTTAAITRLIAVFPFWRICTDQSDPSFSYLIQYS